VAEVRCSCRPPCARLTLASRTLQAAAAEDEDVAELLRDAPDDPAAVEARARGGLVLAAGACTG